MKEPEKTTVRVGEVIPEGDPEDPSWKKGFIRIGEWFAGNPFERSALVALSLIVAILLLILVMPADEEMTISKEPNLIIKAGGGKSLKDYAEMYGLSSWEELAIANADLLLKHTRECDQRRFQSRSCKARIDVDGDLGPLPPLVVDRIFAGDEIIIPPRKNSATKPPATTPQAMTDTPQ